MPSLKIPSSGLPLKPRNEPSKPGVGEPAAFCLTLADGVIEDLINCVKNGKPIQVSFGRTPAILWGSKAQHLLVANDDPFTTELYRTEVNTTKSDAADEMAPPSHFIARVNRQHLVPTTRKTTAKPINLPTETVDPAIAALKAQMDEENVKKKSSSAKFLEKDPTPTKRGTRKAATNTSRFLSQQNKKGFASETARSVPTSPALSGVGSPSLAPTSVPPSQRKAEKDKEVRSWILHYLAADKAKEEEIWDFFSSRTNHTRDEFKTALDNVADYDSASQTWNLRGKKFKELDPWAFEYTSQDQRQKAIDHAIKAFDKMRLGTSEPEWQKLLPESERGQGKILSKLTAKIAEKSSTAPRGKALISPGHETNTETDEDKLMGDSLTVKNGGGEAMSRSASSSSVTKSKKVSEQEAQAKRLLGKPGKAKAAAKSSPATKTSPAKKPAPKKEDTSRIKSSQFVNESDEEDDHPVPDTTKKAVASSAVPKVAAPTSVAKPAVKRTRAENSTEARAPAQPAVKKARKDDGASTPILNGNTSKHRTSDASQFSQNSQVSQSSRSTAPSTAPSTVKTKASTAQKSSPLASSPPTNASDIDEEGPYHTSSSTSPYTSNTLKRKAADMGNTRDTKKPANGVRQRPPPKPVSASSASPASVNGNTKDSQEVSPEVMEMADQFKSFYATYLNLHNRVQKSPNPTEKQIRDLNDMHSKLQKMKDKIFQSV